MTEGKIDDEIKRKRRKGTKKKKKNTQEASKSEERKGGGVGITWIPKLEMKRLQRREMEAGWFHPVFSQNLHVMFNGSIISNIH